MKTDFFIEVEIEVPDRTSTCWVIFVYTNVDRQIKRDQWGYLMQQRQKWGDIWFLGGNLNEIKEDAEKREGRLRSKDSFRMFRDFFQGNGYG